MMIVVAVASALPASSVAELALVAPVIVLCGTPVAFTFAIQLTDADQVKVNLWNCGVPPTAHHLLMILPYLQVTAPFCGVMAIPSGATAAASTVSTTVLLEVAITDTVLEYSFVT
jgi:hypothetical protein